MFGIEDYDYEALKDLIANFLLLESFGIHVEKVEKTKDIFGFANQYLIYYSVPEKSLIDITDNETLNEELLKEEGYLKVGKECYIELINDLLIKVLKESDITEDEIKDIVKFYGKVRKGEVWTEEKAQEAMLNFKKEFDKHFDYREI